MPFISFESISVFQCHFDCAVMDALVINFYLNENMIGIGHWMISPKRWQSDLRRRRDKFLRARVCRWGIGRPDTHLYAAAGSRSCGHGRTLAMREAGRKLSWSTALRVEQHKQAVEIFLIRKASNGNSRRLASASVKNVQSNCMRHVSERSGNEFNLIQERGLCGDMICICLRTPSKLALISWWCSLCMRHEACCPLDFCLVGYQESNKFQTISSYESAAIYSTDFDLYISVTHACN